MGGKPKLFLKLAAGGAMNEKRPVGAARFRNRAVGQMKQHPT